jgi:hypothetical protein
VILQGHLSFPVDRDFTRWAVLQVLDGGAQPLQVGQTQLRPDGDFELRRSSPGKHRVEVWLDRFTRIRADLDLELGTNAWRPTLEPATLVVPRERRLGSDGRQRSCLRIEIERGSSWRAVATITGATQEVLTLPAGKGRWFDVATSGSFPTDDALWELVGAFELEPGSTVTLSSP